MKKKHIRELIYILVKNIWIWIHSVCLHTIIGQNRIMNRHFFTHKDILQAILLVKIPSTLDLCHSRAGGNDIETIYSVKTR